MIDVMNRWGLVVCVVLGCSHNKPPAGPPPPPPPPPSQCAQIADHIVGLMSAGQVAKPEQLDPFRNVINNRCAEDKWSADAQNCLATIKTLDEGDSCQHFLSDEQQKKLEQDGTAAARAGRKAGDDHDDDEGAKKVDIEAPRPPPGAPAERSRSAPAPKGGRKTGDPCSGGQ